MNEGYEILIEPQAQESLDKLDKEMKIQILKKILKLKEEMPQRGLKRMHYSVAEVGQYRLIFKTDEINRKKKISFIGNHKEYERWLGMRK